MKLATKALLFIVCALQSIHAHANVESIRSYSNIKIGDVVILPAHRHSTNSIHLVNKIIKTNQGALFALDDHTQRKRGELYKLESLKENDDFSVEQVVRVLSKDQSFYIFKLNRIAHDSANDIYYYQLSNQRWYTQKNIRPLEMDPMNFKYNIHQQVLHFDKSKKPRFENIVGFLFKKQASQEFELAKIYTNRHNASYVPSAVYTYSPCVSNCLFQPGQSINKNTSVVARYQNGYEEIYQLSNGKYYTATFMSEIKTILDRLYIKERNRKHLKDPNGIFDKDIENTKTKIDTLLNQ